jgi:hypothetical protein
MSYRSFDRPVLVKSGQFMVEEIECLVDAFEFLERWPSDRRGPVYDTALRACQRAYDGQVSLAVARDAFAGFARSVKILEDVSAVMPWMAGSKTDQGGVAG